MPVTYNEKKKSACYNLKIKWRDNYIRCK